MKANKLLLAVMIISLAGMLFFSGCSKTSDTTSMVNAESDESSGDMTIEADEDSVHYESEDGETRVDLELDGSAELPVGYPSDIVPIYPNGTVKLAGVQGSGYVVSVVTDDSIGSVYQYYKDNNNLDAVLSDMPGDDVSMLMGLWGDMNVTIMVSADNMYDEGGTLISIAIGQ